MLKTLQRILADPRIDEISDESGAGDGYWAYTVNGFINAQDGVHCIHEWNMRDMLAKMKELEPCSCRERCCPDAP